MNIPFFGRAFDERFLDRRLKSTSLGGVIGGFAAVSLFAWHFYIDHFVSWDLLAVALTIIVVKWSVMSWYLLTDQS
jgi:hypothetical protein